MTQTTHWTYEYLPYTVTEADGSERELPNYRIHPADEDEMEHYIAETNEHLPGDVQEAHALLISASPQLVEALEYFFNIMHDYESSRRKGYVKNALDMARAALSQAKGGGRHMTPPHRHGPLTYAADASVKLEREPAAP